MSVPQSRTQVLYPIVSAIVRTEDVLGPNRRWNPECAEQQEFLAHTFGAREDLAHIPDITSIASRDAAEINRFLTERGFGIQLDPFENPSDFGTASVLDVLVEWVTRGAKAPLLRKGTETQYPGVRILAKGRSALVFSRKGFPNPIAVLQTKSGDEVWMTVCDPKRLSGIFDRPGVTTTRPTTTGPNIAHGEYGGRSFPMVTNDFDVFDRPGVAADLPTVTDAELVLHDEYGGVTFPMVSYDQQVDISWLRNLNTTGDDELPAIIAQALQQTRFRMNDIGARVESAVALGMTRSMRIEDPKPELIINEPFLCWIRRPNCRLPLFVGYFDTDSWKDPGTLGR